MRLPQGCCGREGPGFTPPCPSLPPSPGAPPGGALRGPGGPCGRAGSSGVSGFLARERGRVISLLASLSPDSLPKYSQGCVEKGRWNLFAVLRCSPSPEGDTRVTHVFCNVEGPGVDGHAEYNETVRKETRSYLSRTHSLFSYAALGRMGGFTTEVAFELGRQKWGKASTGGTGRRLREEAECAKISAKTCTRLQSCGGGRCLVGEGTAVQEGGEGGAGKASLTLQHWTCLCR